MSVSIKPATIRDLTYIGANLNKDDRREIEALLTQDTREIAASHLGPYAFIAWYKGRPITAFGLSPYMGSTWTGWMFGGNESWKTAPQITRFSEHLVEYITEHEGARRIEARSIDGHDKAHRWLTRAFGCGEPYKLPNFGLDGQTFWLFSKETEHVPQ